MKHKLSCYWYFVQREPFSWKLLLRVDEMFSSQLPEQTNFIGGCGSDKVSPANHRSIVKKLNDMKFWWRILVQLRVAAALIWNFNPRKMYVRLATVLQRRVHLNPFLYFLLDVSVHIPSSSIRFIAGRNINGYRTIRSTINWIIKWDFYKSRSMLIQTGRQRWKRNVNVK